MKKLYVACLATIFSIKALATGQITSVSFTIENLSALTAAASDGDPTAQHQLGYAFEIGEGVAQDSQTAFRWYLAAAKQGLKEAQHDVAYAYEIGLGVEVNLEQARLWYQRSAEQGFPLAQNNLGRFYFEGIGVKQDYKLTAKWYQAAADQRHPSALNNLASLYSKGFGVPRNDTKAFELFEAAAYEGSPMACLNLGLIYLEGDRGYEQDFRLAHHWHKLAAERGETQAMYYLAWLYGEGKLGNPNLVFAYGLANAAASGENKLQSRAMLYRGNLQNKMSKEEIKRAQEVSLLLASPANFPEVFAKYASPSSKNK